MKNNINWRDVKDGVHTSDGEVLAVGYQNELLVGCLYSDPSSTTGWGCESDGDVLNEVTHYIPTIYLKASLPRFKKSGKAT
jgi:hypothetical protein